MILKKTIPHITFAEA